MYARSCPATIQSMQAAEDNRATIGSRPPGVEASGEVPSEPVVTIRGLTKRYGAVLAVDDITFSLQAGSITGFLGPNGAGKTTTLRMLLGLARPTAGDALVFDRSYQEL